MDKGKNQKQQAQQAPYTKDRYEQIPTIAPHNSKSRKQNGDH